ncbi:MAG: nuclease [Porphyromonadaceae bacterium]|jgi:micrococcal nuclease|nr:nuclease [Porphyromonadaceae bacterium]
MKLLPLLIFLIFFGKCDQTKASERIQNERFAQENVYYAIHKFVDGDTFWITDGDGRKEKIRFIGIDAPEPRSYGKKKAQPFGKEASAFVESYLKGKKVRLEFDVQKYDRYQRTLAYIFMEDGTLLNDYIVRSGFAVVSTFPPNVKYQHRFLKSERFARDKKLGMWGEKFI